MLSVSNLIVFHLKMCVRHGGATDIDISKSLLNRDSSWLQWNTDAQCTPQNHSEIGTFNCLQKPNHLPPYANLPFFSQCTIFLSFTAGVWSAVHLSRNMWKRSQNAKNEKCIADYRRFVRSLWDAKNMRDATRVYELFRVVYAASWNRFFMFHISTWLVVEAIIMHKTKGFSHAIRDKI